MRLRIIAITSVQVVLIACRISAQPVANARAVRTDALELTHQYQGKLPPANNADLAELQASEDTGLALQAAWQRVVLERRNRSEDKRVNVRSLASSQRFVGFLEGRLRVSVPKWWAKTLLHAGIDRDGDLDLSRRGKSPPPLTLLKTDAGVFATKDWTVSRPSKNLVLTAGDKRFEIPYAAGEKQSPDEVLSATQIGKKESNAVAVALHDTVGQPYRLRYFDDGGRKLCWEANVWCMPPINCGGSGIQMNHFAEIVATDNTIFVFGFTAFSAYIEAFDLRTGKNLFRFGPLYATADL